MMPDFGYTGVGASNGGMLASRAYAHGNPAHWHTAGPTDTIEFIRKYTRVNGSSIVVGVYDMGLGGSDPNGATLVGSATINNTSDTAAWVSVAVNIALTQGHVYFLAEQSTTSARRYFDVGVAGDSTEDLTATTGLNANWTANVSEPRS
jgi:hypothetical protein